MKRRLFSRSDGTYLNKIDPFMRFFPFIMKKRNESAIYFKQQIDITELKAFVHQHNRAVATTGTGVKMTLFHVVLAALVRIAAERPQINRFVIGRRVYQRHELSIAFVIKRKFKDDAKEEIVVMKFTPEDTLESIALRIQNEVHKIRADAKHDEVKRSGIVDWFNVLMYTPRPILSGLVSILAWLDFHGWLPRFVIDLDPMHCSFFVSNLGSLGIDAPFHHLYEWGTTSVFMTIGASERTPVVLDDGTVGVHETLNLAVTLDERIGDGFYYARSLQRFKFIVEHPKELLKPFKPKANRVQPNEEVE
jgi:hypothetical protein